MERNDYYKIACILAFGMIVAAYILTLGSVAEINRVTKECNEKLELSTRNYAICQACLERTNVSDILKEVGRNGTEKEE